MSNWLTDPELLLYAKGTGPGDVLLRRCKKMMSSSSSSLVVPMKSDDFDYVSNVTNHLELIEYMFDWDEPDYKRLVKYIYEKRLLVNSQGLVIAEIYKIDDANEVPIYIRSLDVLPLKPYIPNLRERPIPLRTVKCLGDVNGKAAMMEEKDSNVITKLTARVANLESKNKTLDTNVDDLESKNKTLEGKVTKLTADLVTQMNELSTLQQEVKNIYAYSKEVWMNDLTTREWVGVEGLKKFGSSSPYDDLTIVGSLGTFTVDESSTNVRAIYWYKIELIPSRRIYYKAISLEDLTPNKERARFSMDIWFPFKSKGKTYVCQKSGSHS